MGHGENVDANPEAVLGAMTQLGALGVGNMDVALSAKGLEKTIVKVAASRLAPRDGSGGRMREDVLNQSSVDDSGAPVVIREAGAGEHRSGSFLQSSANTLSYPVALGCVRWRKLLADAVSFAEVGHGAAGVLGARVGVENSDLEVR